MLYAFEHARPGDIFVQKAPASTVGDLAMALRQLMGLDNPIKVIGTRHGEKLYESLISREEMARAEDLGGYYRIPADSRDLNYDKYFVEGELGIAQMEDYTSHNTRRLNVEEIKDVLDEAAPACARPSMLKVMTIVGTRPEIIRLSRVIDGSIGTATTWCIPARTTTTNSTRCSSSELGIRRPDQFLEAAGANAADTIGNVIMRTDRVIEQHQPDALLLLGDTNSALAAIAAKRRKVPIFHMEAGNRCFDFRVPEEINRRIVDHIADINLTYSAIAREYLLREGLPPDQVICTGSPMREVLEHYRAKSNASDVLNGLSLQARRYFLVSAHREENVDGPANLERLVGLINALAERHDLPVVVSTHPRTRNRLEGADLRIDRRAVLHKPFGFLDYVQPADATRGRCCRTAGRSPRSRRSSTSRRSTCGRYTSGPEGFEEGAVMMVGLSVERVHEALKVLEDQPRGEERLLAMVKDYAPTNVADKVLRIILSYTDYVNRKVWKKG